MKRRLRGQIIPCIYYELILNGKLWATSVSSPHKTHICSLGPHSLRSNARWTVEQDRGSCQMSSLCFCCFSTPHGWPITLDCLQWVTIDLFSILWDETISTGWGFISSGLGIRISGGRELKKSWDFKMNFSRDNGGMGVGRGINDSGANAWDIFSGREAK